MTRRKLPLLTLLYASCVVLLCAVRTMRQDWSAQLQKTILQSQEEMSVSPVRMNAAVASFLMMTAQRSFRYVEQRVGVPLVLQPMGNCVNAINGKIEGVILSSSSPKHIFCMAPNTAIRIIYVSLTDNAKVLIGCNTLDYDALAFDIAPQDSIKVEVNTLMNCEMTGYCS